MPAKTRRQRRAAGAELSRRREGKTPKRFKSLPRRKLRKFAKKPS